MPTSAPAPPAAGSPTAPNRRRRVLLVRGIGVVLVLLLLASSAAGLVVRFFQQTETRTTTVSTPVTRLVADTDVGDLRVRAGEPGAPVRVTSTLRWSFRAPVVRVDAADGVLTARGGCQDLFWANGICSTALDLTVAPGTSLELTTGTGPIRVVGISGAVTARSRVGDVVITAAGSPAIQADSGLGDVTVSGAAPGARLTVEAGAGDVRFGLTSPPEDLTARTETGHITVTVPPGDSYRVDAEASIGDVRVRVPRDDAAPRHLDLRSGAGDITVRAGPGGQ